MSEVRPSAHEQKEAGTGGPALRAAAGELAAGCSHWHTDRRSSGPAGAATGTLPTVTSTEYRVVIPQGALTSNPTGLPSGPCSNSL